MYFRQCAGPGIDEGGRPERALEHGTVSVVNLVAAVWLTGRDDAGHDGDPGGILYT